MDREFLTAVAFLFLLLFDSVGRRQIDFMSGIATALPLTTARNSFLEMARINTAAVDIMSVEKTEDGKLRAVLKVTNKAGYYLSSAAVSGCNHRCGTKRTD